MSQDKNLFLEGNTHEDVANRHQHTNTPTQASNNYARKNNLATNLLEWGLTHIRVSKGLFTQTIRISNDKVLLHTTIILVWLAI